jgi:hypothetical protein
MNKNFPMADFSILYTPEMEFFGKYVKGVTVSHPQIIQYREEHQVEQLEGLIRVQRQLRLFEFFKDSLDLTGKPDNKKVIETITCLYRAAVVPGIFYYFGFTNPPEQYLEKHLIEKLPFDFKIENHLIIRTVGKFDLQLIEK